MGDATNWAIFFAVTILIFATCVLPIMAVVLSGAVRLANRVLRSSQPAKLQIEERGGFNTVVDSANPFAPPQIQSVIQEHSGSVVPTVRFRWAILIVFASLVAHFVLHRATVLLFLPSTTAAAGPMVWAASWVLGFLVWSMIRMGMFPTSFARAALVTVIEFLIYLVIVLGVAVVGVVSDLLL